MFKLPKLIQPLVIGFVTGVLVVGFGVITEALGFCNASKLNVDAIFGVVGFAGSVVLAVYRFGV
jgi:hypothetical protein